MAVGRHSNVIYFFSLASGKSIWKGIDLYQKGKVKICHKESETIFTGRVEGSSDQTYQVRIDLDHPKRSTCTCPFAKGRRVVCKHMIALSCEAVPSAYDEWMDDVVTWEEEDERARERHLNDLKTYVYSLKKAELRECLYSALLEIEELKESRW